MSVRVLQAVVQAPGPKRAGVRCAVARVGVALPAVRRLRRAVVAGGEAVAGHGGDPGVLGPGGGGAPTGEARDSFAFVVVAWVSVRECHPARCAGRNGCVQLAAWYRGYGQRLWLASACTSASSWPSATPAATGSGTRTRSPAWRRSRRCGHRGSRRGRGTSERASRSRRQGADPCAAARIIGASETARAAHG